MTGGGSVREASARDLDRVVAVHRAAFAGFFMTQLGPRFLREYYRTVLAYEGGVLLVAEAGEEGDLRGFVAGFVDPPRYYRFLGQRRLALALAMLPAIAARPTLVPRVLSNRREARQRGDDGSLDGGGSATAELASIGVAPSAAGRGLGTDLVTHFCRKVRDLGATKVFLTTDSHENEDVNKFYLRNGFVHCGHSGAYKDRVMNKYVLELQQNGSAPYLD